MHAIGWGVPGVPGFRQISECLQILKPIEDLEVVLDINRIHSIDWTSSYSNNADSQRESVQIPYWSETLMHTDVHKVVQVTLFCFFFLFFVTIWLQETWDPKAVVSYPEGIFHIFLGISQQGFPHVYQGGVNGFDDGQEGQTTCPTFSKVLNSDTIPLQQNSTIVKKQSTTISLTDKNVSS